MPDLPPDAEHAIWQAQPHAVATVALEVIRAQLPVRGAEIYLTDYPMTHLVPVTADLEAVRVDTTPAGRAFAAQQGVTETPGGPGGEPYRLHLPLTVHGDRLGVLTVSTDAALSADERQRLEGLMSVTARALKLADTSTDTYRRIRRRRHRLTLAAEMQWELLPGRSCAGPEFRLAGQLEPAYAVCGDNYDWSADGDLLTITISNGMGQGVDAALLTHLATSTMRNARRSGAGLVDQAILANEIVYSQYGGELNVATLLLGCDLNSGKVRVVDAGSPQIRRMRGASVELIAPEAQLPLGMFYDTVYTEQEFALDPGDRLVLVSDGVHTALSPSGAPYSALALPRALRTTRRQDPSEVVRTITRELLEYHEGSDLQDDAVVLCLDWTPATGRA
jgi:serine phosphatase RsbU (regulator of sigma subunit)